LDWPHPVQSSAAENKVAANLSLCLIFTGTIGNRIGTFPSSPNTSPQPSPVPKAPEDWRTPGRFARFEAATNSARSWSAPVLWRFTDGTPLAKVGRAVPSAPQMFEMIENF